MLGKSVVIPQFSTPNSFVGVGLTFQPFVGATLTSFVGPTIFVSQQMKTVGVGGNYAPYVVALLLLLQILALKKSPQQFHGSNMPTVFTVGEPKSVGPTKFPQQKGESNSNTNSSYCW